MARLPIPGQDVGTWGDVLNDFLSQTLNADGSLKQAGDISTALSTANAAKATADTAVQSVNGKSGTNQTLTQDDVADGTTAKQYTGTEKTKLAGIATGATANTVGTTSGTVAAGNDTRIVGAQQTTGQLVNLGNLVGVTDGAQVAGQSFYSGGYVGPASLSSVVGDGTTVTVTFASNHNIPSGKVATIGISGCSTAGFNGVWQMNYSSATVLTFSSSVSGTAATPGTACYAGVTYYQGHATVAGVSSIRLVYTNWAEGQVSNVTNAITIKASIYASSTLIPVFFNGVRTKTIEAGGMAISDPIGTISLSAAGSTFTTMTFITQPSGKSAAMWPTGAYLWRTGDGIVQGYDATDTYSVPTFAGSNAYSFTPTIILGTPTNKNAALVAIVGDSILSGTNDSDDNGVYKALRGYAERACLSNGYGFVKIASSGDTASNFATMALSARRLALIQGCTHAICDYGVNDFTFGKSVAQLQASLTIIWASLKASGMKVYQSLILPRNSSTDSFATTANQTPINSAANNVTINNWIKAQVGTLIDGYLDTVSVCCSDSTSYLWKANGTANYATLDGLHPTKTLHQAMAALVPTTWTTTS